MRALVFAWLVLLAGCNIDNDPVRVDSFAADAPATFTYDAWANSVMTANDDGGVEQIRRDWLAEALTNVRSRLCRRDTAVRAAMAGAVRQCGDIVYTGRCQ